MIFGKCSIAVVAASLGGCTILTSETFDQLKEDGRAPRGVQYSLAKGLIHALLTVDPSTLEFVMTLTPGEIVPDPDYSYVLRYRPNPTYDDNILVKTDEKGLLSKIETTTVDRTADIIVNLAKAVGALGKLETGEQAKPVERLYEDRFDPYSAPERNTVIGRINERISGYIGTTVASCRLAGAPNSDAARYRDAVDKQLGPIQIEVQALQDRKAILDEAVKAAMKLTVAEIAQPKRDDAIVCPKKVPDLPKSNMEVTCKFLSEQRSVQEKLTTKLRQKEKLETELAGHVTQQEAREQACGALAKLKNNPPRARISLPELYDGSTRQDSHDGAGHAETRKKVPEADCTIGVCYRSIEPMRITYSLGLGSSTLIANLPDPNEAVSVDIRRAFFVKKIQKMDFADGALTKLHIDKASELAAISKLPVQIVEAIAEGIQLRVNVKTEQKNVLDKEAALINARAELAKTRAGGLAQGAVENSSVGRGVARKPGASSRPVLP